MKQRRGDGIKGGLAALVLLVPTVGTTGCIPRVPIESVSLPAPPSESIRSGFGTVAVVVEDEVPPLEFTRPIHGWAAGVGLGLGRGVGGAIALTLGGAAAGGGGGGPAAVLTMAAGAALGAAVGLLYIPVSTVAGGVTAESSDRVERAEQEVLRVMAELDLPERLRKEMLRTARGAYGDVVAGEAGELARERYRVLAARGIGTVLEVRLLGVWNGPILDAFTFNKSFAVFMAAQTRLIQTEGGTVLYSQILTYRTPRQFRTYSQWGDAGGQALRKELEQACLLLSEKITEEVFLIDLRME